MAAGATFINPHYASPKLEFFNSQHPYLEAVTDKRYMCPVNLEDEGTVLACVRAALDGPDLPPFVPPEMTRDAYLQRVKGLFEPALHAPLQQQGGG